jgi:hypothetical protein
MAAATNNRTAEDVRRDIATEREQLAASVDDLRAGLGEATDVTGKLRDRLPAVAVGVIAGGIGAAARLLFRRGREGREKARVGPFAFIDRR